MRQVSDHALKVSTKCIKMYVLPHFPQMMVVIIYTFIYSKGRCSLFLLSPGEWSPFSTMVAGIAF